MSNCRIALANIRYPATREESVTLAQQAIAEAARAGAEIICFPECYVPGYRTVNKQVLPPDPAFLERAWSNIAAAVVQPDGTVLCFQPYGEEGLLLADIDPSKATGLLAARYRPV